MAEFEGAVGAAPTDAELERTILSVPGVADASVHRHEDGRSRLRLRLHPGEDAEPVSWAVAATLRERFAIALDPKAIRQVVDAAPTAVDDAAPDRADLPSDEADLPSDEADLPSDEAGAQAIDAGAPDDRAEAPPAPEPIAETSASAPAEPVVDPVEAASAPRPDVETAADASTRPTAEPAVDTAEPAVDTAEPAVDTAEPAVDTAAAPSLSELRSEGPVRLLGPELAGSSERLAPRAAIHHLDVQRGEAGVRVTATLGHEGRRADGSATAVATSIGVRRAVAEATVSAMRSLLGGSLLIGVDHVAVRSGEDPALATAVLTWLTDRGEETLVGTSLLRSDPEQAVMRATLDALNRRVEPLLVGDAHLPR